MPGRVPYYFSRGVSSRQEPIKGTRAPPLLREFRVYGRWPVKECFSSWVAGRSTIAEDYDSDCRMSVWSNRLDDFAAASGVDPDDMPVASSRIQ